MDLGLKDKVVVCMSSASGFGKGIATEFAREGAKVVICTSEAFKAEEIKRNISISLAVAPVKYKNVKINVLDTPGNFDFAGEVLSGIRAVECAD